MERELLAQAVSSLAARGLSLRQAADELGVPKSTVHRILSLAASENTATATPENSDVRSTPPGRSEPDDGCLTTSPSEPAPSSIASRGRTRKRERWFVVETKPDYQDDLDHAVVIMSSHASEAGAIRGRSRLRRRGVPEGVVYAIRPEHEIRRRLTWDSELKRGVTREGPPPPR